MIYIVGLSKTHTQTYYFLAEGSTVIEAESISRYLNEEPDVMRALLQQMSTRLRRISRDCTDACRTVNAVVEAEKAGKTEDPALKNRIAKTLAGFEASRLEGREEGGNDA